MSRDRSFPLSKGVLKDAFVFLALSALLLVLARPVCDVLEWHGAQDAGPSGLASYVADESGHHEGHTDPCCDSIEDGNLAVSASAAPPVERPAIPAAAIVAPARPVAVLTHVAWLPPDTPPISRPYHVRSARLLI